MIQLITDRTESDVLLQTEKGLYGASDFNRVESAVKEIVDLLPKLDIAIDLVTKTDWDKPGTFSPEQWPIYSQMIRYLENIRSVCGFLSLQAILPDSMEHLSWESANQIETTLHSAQSRVSGILNTYKYSGDLFAGEENVL